MCISGPQAVSDPSTDGYGLLARLLVMSSCAVVAAVVVVVVVVVFSCSWSGLSD